MLLPRRRIATNLLINLARFGAPPCVGASAVRVALVLSRDRPRRNLLCHYRASPFPRSTRYYGEQATPGSSARLTHQVVADDVGVAHRQGRLGGGLRASPAPPAGADVRASPICLAGADTAADAERRRGLRRMKVVATFSLVRPHRFVPGLPLGRGQRCRSVGRGCGRRLGGRHGRVPSPIGSR